MLRPCTLFALAIWSLLVSAPLTWAGPADDLAALIKRSSESGSPVMTFFTGAQALPD